MPSEIIDSHGEEISSCDERPVGLWKLDAVHSFYGVNADGTLPTVASSPIQKRMPMDSQMVKGFELPDSFPNRDRKINPPMEKLTLGPGKAASLSLPQAFEHTLGSASYFTGGDKVNFTGASYENGLFSSSLSELFTRKLRLLSNNTPYGYSVDAPKRHEEEEPFESLEELEAQTIGNLLPDDDDLFSGVTDVIDSSACPIGGGDMEELDLFSSVGGLDLGEDGSSPVPKNPGAFKGNSSSQLGGTRGETGLEYPVGENPSRTLFVRNINSNIEDSELRALFEQYGDIRTMYTVCKYRGFVMISYYDIRAAWNAMKALQNKPLRHRKLDLHYSIPKDNHSDKDINQGTLMVFNLEPSVPNDELRQIFGVYGEIKEIRETPNRNHKFVEFYDVRAAEAALCAVDGSDIAGMRIKVELSCPGDARWSMHQFSSELDQDASGFYMQRSSPPANLLLGFHGSISHGGITSNVDSDTVPGARATNGLPLSPYIENVFRHGVSSSVPNNLPSLLNMKSIGSQSNTGEASNSHYQLKFDIQGSPNFHPHSLPDCHDGLANGALSESPGNMASNMNVRSLELLEEPIHRVSSNAHSIELNDNVLNATGNGSCLSPGHRYVWSNSHHQQPQGMMLPNSPSFINGTGSASRQQLHAVPKAPSLLPNGLLPMYDHLVGSAPSANPCLWERQHAYAGDSPDASAFYPGSLGSMRIPGTSPHLMEFIPHGLFPHNGGSSMDLPIPSKNAQLHSYNQRCLMIPARGQMIPIMSSFDSPNERTRSRRHEGSSSSQGDNKKQFELDIDRIMRGVDKRTTLMIKNIPNKYTSKMLLAAIDERHRGTYDFLYLPIDFKNKCNVGYAFINMTDPGLIVPFYHAFNGKKWEKFNSEKVATLAYARIQGKAALIAHFQNSSLMNEDKRCRPILFHSDGPNAGDQVPFPMGTNIRSRPSKNRSATADENNQEGLPNSGKEEEPSNGSSSSVSVRLSGFGNSDANFCRSKSQVEPTKFY